MLQINGIAVVLLGGSLRVTGRGGSTSAPFDAGYPRVEDDTVVVRATFSERDANFEWSKVEVLTADGVALDVDETDHGRKSTGSIWTLETHVQLREAAPA
jgi:hypothetical protein